MPLRTRQKWALGIAAAWLWLGARRVHASSASRRRGAPPAGPERTARHEPAELTGDVCAFGRYVIPRLVALGLSPRSALLFAAHLARETGSGRSVFNNAWGNIRAFSDWEGPWHRLSDGLAYRSYSSPEEGLAAAVRLVRTGARYAEAWRRLEAGDASWYGALGLAGYYEHRPRDPSTGRRLAARPHTAETIREPQGEFDVLVRRLERCA